MAIVQISKIIHRTGANVDLPQLDIGELGFATDEQRLYVGNDPSIIPPIGAGTTQTEILTAASSLDFSRINGSSNTTMELSTLETGQLLGVSVASNIATIVNVGGNAGGAVTLGNASNVKLTGGVNGHVLQTDGTGNLSWINNGIITAAIANVSQTNPAVVTTSHNHFLGIGTQVFMSNVSGMTNLNTGGASGTNLFYAKRLTEKTFSLYSDASLVSTVNATLFFPAVANTGNAYSQIIATGNSVPGGSSTQIQFNDTGTTFGGVSNFTFNKTTNVLAVVGNVTASNVTANLFGAYNGVIGATTPNLATFSSVTVNNTVNVTGNVNAGNISTSNVKLAVGLENWSIFANAAGLFVTDSATGNTFSIGLTQV